MDQPSKVANPPRGQLNGGKCFFNPDSVRAREFGLARQVWPSGPASARSFSILRLNLGIPPAFYTPPKLSVSHMSADHEQWQLRVFFM